MKCVKTSPLKKPTIQYVDTANDLLNQQNVLNICYQTENFINREPAIVNF